jgi:hypothetical protein
MIIRVEMRYTVSGIWYYYGSISNLGWPYRKPRNVSFGLFQMNLFVEPMVAAILRLFQVN